MAPERIENAQPAGLSRTVYKYNSRKKTPSMIGLGAMRLQHLLSNDKSTFRTPLRAGCLLAGMVALLAPLQAAPVVTTGYLVYVVSGTRIEAFNSANGAFVFQFGGTGTGPGQFQLPSGIAVNNNTGNVWVTDALLNRVQEFNSNGTFLMQFGSTGKGPGFLYQPYGIATDIYGNVWVADTGNNRIEEFSAAGTFLQQLGGLGGGNGQFNAPVGVAVDLASNIWVADTGNNRIQQFAQSGGGAGTASTVTFTLKFGSYGNGAGQFRGIGGIAVDIAHNVWVADSQNQRIQEFSSAGALVRSVLGPFSYPSPYGDAIDGNSNVWAVDYNTNQVLEFNGAGTKIMTFGTTGGGPGQLYHPTYIAVSSFPNG
jgi:DNA-binding beta-propeller fold protein YncE